MMEFTDNMEVFKEIREQTPYARKYGNQNVIRAEYKNYDVYYIRCVEKDKTMNFAGIGSNIGTVISIYRDRIVFHVALIGSITIRKPAQKIYIKKRKIVFEFDDCIIQVIFSVHLGACI